MRACILPIGLVCAIYAGPVPPAAAQTPLAKKSATQDFSLDMPRPDQLFRSQSEEQLRDEIRTANFARGVKKVQFPPTFEPIPPVGKHLTSNSPNSIDRPVTRVCFNTLYYEDVRTEREVRSCGCVEPLRSAFLFYGKTLALPMLMLHTWPCEYQCVDYR